MTYEKVRIKNGFELRTVLYIIYCECNLLYKVLFKVRTNRFFFPCLK